MAKWTDDERERRDKVIAGETVLANLTMDHQLIEWAKDEGLYVYIGRPSAWRNPYVVGEDGDRTTCIKSFKLYFARKLGLQKRIGELRGKVLGCYCHPEACHGCVLIHYTQENTQ